MLALKEIADYHLLPEDLVSSAKRWREWLELERPEDEPLPGEPRPLAQKDGRAAAVHANTSNAWHLLIGRQPVAAGDWKRMPEFNRLLLFHALRPDRLTAAMSKFVAGTLGREGGHAAGMGHGAAGLRMAPLLPPASPNHYHLAMWRGAGKEYVTSQPFNLERSFQDAQPGTPIFVFLSPGVDVAGSVEALGRRLGFTAENGRYFSVSLGQGQVRWEPQQAPFRWIASFLGCRQDGCVMAAAAPSSAPFSRVRRRASP